MVETKPTSLCTFYAQYVRRKKVNILIGSVFCSLFIAFFHTTSKLKYIQNDILKSRDQHINSADKQGK